MLSPLITDKFYLLELKKKFTYGTLSEILSIPLDQNMLKMLIPSIIKNGFLKLNMLPTKTNKLEKDKLFPLTSPLSVGMEDLNSGKPT